MSQPETEEPISPSRYFRLVLFGAAIGIPAALLGALFLAAVHELEHLLWTDLPKWIGHSSPPWYLVIFLPVLGAIVVLIARVLLPGDGGHPPLEGFGGKPISPENVPSVALAAIGTLAFGAVLGPEAPLIALGSATGLVVTLFIKFTKQESAVLASAGSFSAISALFGGPIVGGMLMIEAGVGLGKKLIPALIPGFVAAAVGYVLFVGLGDWGGISTQNLDVPGLPLYDGTSVPDLLLALAIGIIAAFFITIVRSIASGVAGDGIRRLGLAKLLLGGALALGIIAQTAVWLGADYQDVLFSGQSSLPSLVAQTSTKIVLILLVAKGLAYAISLGCGFRGGPVFPAIFLGTALATFAVVWFGVSPTFAVAVGTAAGMTAMTRLLLTPMVLATLLVGDNGFDAVPAAVLAAVAAWLTMAALDRKNSMLNPTTAQET